MGSMRTARRAGRAGGLAVLLALAGLALPAGAAAEPEAKPMTAERMAAVTGPSPGTFTGEGFDACTAPSSATMQAWLASPYRAVGIYFGGVNRGCLQPNLTPSWVTAQQAAGWRLIPLYVGLQAPCTTSTKPYRIDPANAAGQGRAAAEDAVVQAMTLGLAKESVLIYDMEAYATGDTACRNAVLSFMSAWTARLHDLGYLSGFYSSMASGVADQVAAYSTPGYVRPDYLDFARWDNIATVSDPAIPDSYWSPKRRMKQYRGGHPETYGGVTINIDNDYLDMAPLPASPFGDFTGNGWPDLLARNNSNARLTMYTGNGTNLAGPVTVGWGWNIMNVIIRHGDFTRDGREDVITREPATGYLWLYPGTGSGFGARIRIGVGWNGMREITAAGDFNRDGYPDVLAVQATTGKLFLYPGSGTALTGPITVGWGWNGMDELTGVGDLTGDGYVDLVTREIATGNLYVYPGLGHGFGGRSLVGTGWNARRDLVGIGDYDRDGRPDLVAVEKSTGDLHRYPWTGSTYGTRVRIGVGWGPMQPLL